MTHKEENFTPSSQQHKALLANWDNEECAAGGTALAASISEDLRSEMPSLTHAELQQLHVRVIALENLVIALLASASDRQCELAREMAAYISPRPGATPHALTIHAAAEMISIVERAGQFRIKTPPIA